jgi:hypothetical protein
MVSPLEPIELLLFFIEFASSTKSGIADLPDADKGKVFRGQCQVSGFKQKQTKETEKETSLPLLPSVEAQFRCSEVHLPGGHCPGLSSPGPSGPGSA